MTPYNLDVNLKDSVDIFWLTVTNVPHYIRPNSFMKRDGQEATSWTGGSGNVSVTERLKQPHLALYSGVVYFPHKGQ